MKIAIAGYGVEGAANYRYFRSLGDVTIVDENDAPNRPLPEGAATILGAGVFSKLQDFDMVVRTAGLAPRKISTNGTIWSATNEFFSRCPAPIIGVTGTKGKGTTSSLIASILQAAGKTVHLVGNIGTPALEVLPMIQPNDVVVFELSSFQLWDLEKSPQIAVVLMIEPDHLDVHASFDEYVAAKANICRFQQPEDACLYHPTNAYARQIAATSPARTRTYGNPDGAVYVNDGYFMSGERRICPTSALELVGVHNLENACAAMSAALEFDASMSDQQFADGLAGFTGLPHRLKFVAEVDGVKYYDDSIATTPGSALAALASFVEPKVLILGGSDKGAAYDEVIAGAQAAGAKIVAIGQTGRTIVKLAAEKAIDAVYVDGLMDEVVAKAAELATAGSVVILSPASASFDQYKNYADRGDQFVAAVTGMQRGY